MNVTGYEIQNDALLCRRLPKAQNSSVMELLVITTVVVALFICIKTCLDGFIQRFARVTVVIIGGGPIGLTSVLIAAKSMKSARIILYEEHTRTDLIYRSLQVAFDQKSLNFLRNLGIDFDNIEGCMQKNNDAFFTRLGVYEEYLLSIIHQMNASIDLRLGTKFTKDSLKELDGIPGRVLAIVCDGSEGHSARWLGLSDEFTQHSCRAYGAVAAIERPEERQVPTPEIRVHGLTFDLTAFFPDLDEFFPPNGFHFKIFGSIRHRYMALAVPKSESKIVRALKVVLDKSVMRSIFQQCYNRFKDSSEKTIHDSLALKSLKFSPRLLEIKLSTRLESVVYIEDANIFVVTEGEASRCLSFHSGMDINLGIRGLQSLQHFINLAASASTEQGIIKALCYKSHHTQQVANEFLRHGLRDYMFT